MFLKIMSGEDAPDSDSRKTFQLLDHVASAEFERENGRALAHVLFVSGEEESYPLEGNAYLMNDAGKTVASFGSAPYHPGAK